MTFIRVGTKASRGSLLIILAALAGCAAPGAPDQALAISSAGASVDKLVGVSAEKLEAMLGPPALLRREGPAEVWLYRSPACAVDLILYADPPTGSPHVTEADTRPLGAPVSEANCLASVANAPKASPGLVAGGKF